MYQRNMKHEMWQNVDIFGVMSQKRFFKCFQKHFHFLEVLIFSDTFAKNYFFKWTKTTVSKWAQKTSFFSKCWYFWRYGKTTIFAKKFKEKILYLQFLYFRRYAEKIFFKVISKIPALSGNVDIFEYMAKKRRFQVEMT